MTVYSSNYFKICIVKLLLQNKWSSFTIVIIMPEHSIFISSILLMLVLFLFMSVIYYFKNVFSLHFYRQKQQVTTQVCILILQPDKIQESTLLQQRMTMVKTLQILKLWWWTSLVFPKDHFLTPTPLKTVCHSHGTHQQMMEVEILQVFV